MTPGHRLECSECGRLSIGRATGWTIHHQDPGELYDDIEQVPCPCCGKPIYEQAEICPHCRSYISREDSLPPRKPKWLVIGAVVTVVVILVVWGMLRR